MNRVLVVLFQVTLNHTILFRSFVSYQGISTFLVWMQEMDEPPRLLGMPLNETLVQIVGTIAFSGLTAAGSALVQSFQNRLVE